MGCERDYALKKFPPSAAKGLVPYSVPSVEKTGHKPKLSKGQVVTIYEDPITQQRPEGKATLIKFHFAQWDQEYWTVRFQEDGALTSRWVKIPTSAQI
jgi:hypothetical protein